MSKGDVLKYPAMMVENKRLIGVVVPVKDMWGREADWSYKVFTQ